MSLDRCDLLCLDLQTGESIRRELPAPSAIQDAAGRAKALSDPTRLEIALALSYADELCGCDLAWICSRQENLISHHLRTLRKTAIVTSRREGKMVMHALTDQGRSLLRSITNLQASPK